MIAEPVPSGELRREAGLAHPQPAGERWKHALGLFSSYWTSKDWKFAWSGLLILLAFEMGSVYLIVWENGWQQQFFDSIESRRINLFLPLLTVYVLILALQIGQIIVSTYLGQTISLRWRIFLTERYTNRWLAHSRYYEIERLRLVDNPDQRIAEDIDLFTREALSIGISFITSTVSAVSFVIILLRTAESIHLALFGYAIAVPGDIVWYGLLYVVGGTVAITYIGRPFILRTMRQQHYEADFRANLIHVRRNAAQIGFARTIDVERRSLTQNFTNICGNCRQLILTQLGLSASNGLYDRIGSMIPLVVTVPHYFAGRMTFGQVMSTSDAFGTLVMNLSYFIKIYPQIARQVAYVNRMKALDDALDAHRPRGISFDPGGTGQGVDIAVRKLQILRPHGAPLLELGDWIVATGQRWVIQGPSGAGKSTLLRAIIGLWPDGSGEVALTDRGTAMFVPQRLYLPLGTLKDAICFPDTAEMHDDQTVLALLDQVRLSVHNADLHAIRMWQEDLSPGEQQRVALARILLHRPDLVVLDEATSALDEDNARYFHETLLSAFPGVTLVNVVHDDRLRLYHTHSLTIADGRATCAPIAHEGE